MVLGRIADELVSGLGRVQAEAEGLLFEPVLRLGVTGLSRAGKTVFITSLVANMLDRGKMPQLRAEAEGRIVAAFLQPQPDDGVPRFAFEDHRAALSGPEPVWPASTRAISELRLSLKVRPASWLSGLAGVRTLHLDIVDYPGEWLLDLPLMTMDFAAWSEAELAKPAGAAWTAALQGIEPEAELAEPVAAGLAVAWTDELTRRREAGMADCTPGRFLMPGDLAGSPALTFAPLPPAPRAKGGSLHAQFARRFEAYKRIVVRPFFRDHFARIDRQVVLVDALGA
ncbi:MAG: YcjX family protein, partial [Pseudomonadota bacterium]